MFLKLERLATKVTFKGYVFSEIALDKVIDLFLTWREPIGQLLNGLIKHALCAALLFLTFIRSELTVHGEHRVSLIWQIMIFPEFLPSSHRAVKIGGP